MDNSQAQSEMDPWAKMGNYGGNKEPSLADIERADAWAASMETAPEFVDQNETENSEPQIEQYDKTISGAANLLNYGLDGMAREIGVEQTMQAIKTYDPSSSLDDPIKGLYESVGIDTKKEYEDIRDTNIANRDLVNEYRNSANAPSSFEHNTEHALKALFDAKELVSAVESSPEYSSLREGAKRAEMGYFQFATHDIPHAGLVDLFGRLNGMKDEIPDEEKTLDENESLDEEKAPEEEKSPNENEDEIIDEEEAQSEEETPGETETIDEEAPDEDASNLSESPKDPSVAQPEIPAEEELHNQQI